MSQAYPQRYFSPEAKPHNVPVLACTLTFQWKHLVAPGQTESSSEFHALLNLLVPVGGAGVEGVPASKQYICSQLGPLCTHILSSHPRKTQQRNEASTVAVRGAGPGLDPAGPKPGSRATRLQPRAGDALGSLNRAGSHPVSPAFPRSPSPCRVLTATHSNEHQRRHSA